MRHLGILLGVAIIVLGLGLFWMWPRETGEAGDGGTAAGPSLVSNIVGFVFFIVVLVALVKGVIWLVNVCRRHKESEAGRVM